MRPTARWRRSTPRIGSRGPEVRLGKTYRACSSPDRAFGSGPKGSRFDSCQAHYTPHSNVQPPTGIAPDEAIHRSCLRSSALLRFLFLQQLPLGPKPVLIVVAASLLRL